MGPDHQGCRYYPAIAPDHLSRLRGEVEAGAQRRLRVRGILHALGLAESPPHPDRIWRCDPTSPRKRGEVIRRYTSFTFLSGRLRIGLPVAAKTALSTAGATTQMVGSPTPPQKS